MGFMGYRDLLDNMQVETERPKVVASASLADYLTRASSEVQVQAKLRPNEAEWVYSCIKSAPNTYLCHSLALPGRRIGELLAGAKRFGQKNGKWANDEAPPRDWVYLSAMDHPDYPVEHDDKGYFWSWRVPCHPDIRAFWEASIGPVHAYPMGLSLELVRRDGSDLLVGNLSGIIGSRWITVNEL